MASFPASKSDYEQWMAKNLGSDLVAEDLAAKGRAMRESAFVFLRATYWRWAETILDVSPALGGAPAVLSVGDIHLENFGTWRDAEGRLVFGVNDFDEAAEMPYALDLVRLAASALLGGETGKAGAGEIAHAILEGYADGVDAPRPIVLEKDMQWLREHVVVPEKRRRKFWRNVGKLEAETPPQRYLHALRSAMPERGLDIATARRVAGTGSLGRPRWLGVAEWRGAPAVREAKALLPSAWCLAHGASRTSIRSGEIADGRYRSPDPWYRVADGIVVRRLSPNNRKIEAGKATAFLHEAGIHQVMGWDLGNIHVGVRDAREAIKADLRRRPDGWLAEAAVAAAEAVTADYKAWKRA